MQMASHCSEKNAGLKMQEEGLIALIPNSVIVEEGLIALIPKMGGREVNQPCQASSLAMDAICPLADYT
jgi:hypothetical protein